MPRNDALILADIDGKLDYLRIACACGRAGQYAVARLIARHGPETSLIALKDALTRDCPRYGGRDHERCQANFPELPRVL